MNRWKTIVTLLAAVALAYAAFAPVANTQPSGWLSYIVQDPQAVVQFRAMGAYGAPAMPGVGTAAPTMANSGLPPVNGEQFLVRDNASANEPVLTFYSGASTAWRSIPISTLATNAPDVANSVWFGTGEIIFEGATANAFENEFRTADPTVGVATFLLPDQAAAADIYPIMWSLLATNSLQTANSIWFDTNMVVWEGATADAFETRLIAQDADTGVHTFQLPDNDAAADIYNLMFSLLDTNALQVANSVWFDTNEMRFEGATADAFETVLIAEDADVGVHTFQLPDNAVAADTYNLMFSVLDTNALDVANSIWFEANQMWFEGAAADAFEIVITAAESTVGVDTYSFADHAAAADTYLVTAVPDISQTTGNLYYGEYTDAVAAAGEADDVMIVQRIFIPHAVTVIQVDILNIDAANASAGDNTIAVSIYEDADAGAQIVELVGATDDGAGNATGLYSLDIADTVLQPGWYRVGFCAQDSSDNDIEVHTAQADILLLWAAGALASEFTSTAAAAPCVNGDPAAATGVLTQAAHKVPFMLRTQ